MNDDQFLPIPPADQLPAGLPRDAVGGAPHGSGLVLELARDWEELAERLGAQLAVPPADPFASQLVVVEQPAARRALSQELARRTGGAAGAGICAGIDFLGQRALRRRLEQELLGQDAGSDPWRRRGLALAVLDVMDEVADQAWFAPVAHHLGSGSVARDGSTHAGRPGRRLATADTIAHLFLRYCRTSPELVRAWSAGDLVGPDGATLPERQLWQPRLWQAVRERLDGNDPVSRHEALLAALSDRSKAPAGAPGVLAALAAGGTPLQVVQPVPCARLDRELVSALARRAAVVVHQLDAAQVPDEPGLAEAALLAERWGAVRRSGVPQWTSLADTVHPAGTVQQVPGALRVGDAVPGTARGTTALERLQEVLAGARPTPGEDRPVAPSPASGPDGSVQVHLSHGADRQVEALREVLCGLLEDDPSLEPRDIVVASTDLATHAPLVRAAFCLDPDQVDARLHPGHGLRVQVADASVDRPNQVVEVLQTMLRLAGDRAGAADLVALCQAPPVAQRFGLGPDEFERITRLVGQADIRWGLDAGHRAEFGLAQVRQSTWLAGIERILLGIAVGPTPPTWVGTALPVEQVDGSDVMAAGVLAEVVSRVRKLAGTWRTEATVATWIARLTEALDLLVATPRDEAWQLSQARASLADLSEVALERQALLGLGDVRALFDRLLRPGSGRANYGNGSLLVCRLEDLADVPHRVVVVLGLDERSFPARPRPEGDDLVAALPGDPQEDPRALSRQRLLDALCSARERFVVVHQGWAPRTNEPVPRPVTVMDLVNACRPLGGVLEVRHGLQPQSSGNFDTGQGHPLSFDRAALVGARSHQSREPWPQAATPLWRVSLAPLEQAGALDLEQLVDFYRNPARALLRHSLGLSMSEWDDLLEVDLPIEPDGLQEWRIGDRMVRLALDGMDAQGVAQAERLRGELPPGQLGARSLHKLMPQVTKVVNSALRERSAPAVDLDCEVELSLPRGASTLLTGRVRVHEGTVVSHAFSRTSAPHLLQAWFQLLLLAASQQPSEHRVATGWRAVHVGRDAIATLTAPPAEEARRLLGELVEVRQLGLTRLVPLPARSAAELMRVTPLRPFRDHDPESSARRAWRQEHDADWARFLPDDLDALRALPGDGQDPGAPGPSRFENLADWLFTPLRGQMSVGNLR